MVPEPYTPELHTLGYESSTPVQRVRVPPQHAAGGGGYPPADAARGGNGWMMERPAGEPIGVQG